jgi:ClpP class serine protease
MNLLSEVSGGTTFEALTKQLQAAVADPDVKTIVFDVDSPGGNVAGASEFAREVLRARATKPIIVQAHHLLASAAYWPMAGATESLNVGVAASAR